MKKFVYYIKDKKTELTIKERINHYSCIVDVAMDGEIIATDEKASICAVAERPGKLYLQFASSLNTNTMLSICDKENEDKSSRESVEKNREIADYIWENVQNADIYQLSYLFTTSHWANFED